MFPGWPLPCPMQTTEKTMKYAIAITANTPDGEMDMSFKANDLDLTGIIGCFTTTYPEITSLVVTIVILGE